MLISPLSRLFTIVLLCASAPAALANWTVNSDLSRLSFVSMKATHIAEVHKFSKFSGGLADSGAIDVEINLASLDTLIPIRNERMLEFLFEAATYPTATISGQVDPAAIKALQSGEVAILAIEAMVTIKDSQTPVTTEVLVSRHDNRVVVTSLQPVVLNTASLGLSAGVEKLRELAGLPSISQSVPVSLVMTFDADQFFQSASLLKRQRVATVSHQKNVTHAEQRTDQADMFTHTLTAQSHHAETNISQQRDQLHQQPALPGPARQAES